MLDNNKFVDFQQYCPLCEHKDASPTSEVCDECLSVPARENSHKPENFKEKEK